jgi:glycosyltransferase involved in cell wall biosynthesis
MHAQSKLDRPGTLPAPLAASPDGLAEAEAQPLRVCFISPLGYGLYQRASGLPFGGAEVQFYLISGEIASDPDFRVTVLTTVTDGPGRELHDRLTVVKRRAGGRLSECDGPGLSVLRALPGYGSAFADMLRAFREIDAEVYLHAGAGVEVGAYALVARLLRRRFIYVVASSADLDRPNGLVTGPLRWLYGVGVRLADRVICRTEEQLGWLRERYGRGGLLIRTGHPVTGQRGSESGRDILWVGRIHPLKQPEMFLDLAERLAGQSCVMVAARDPIHSELWKRVKDRAARMPNLAFYEDVPWSRIGEQFGCAKLFVNTSTYEGFPNTFVQAAMGGVPILSWKVDPDRVLLQHRIGCSAGGSFEELAVVAERLCECEAERLEIGRRAREYGRSHHALERIASEWKELLRSVSR